MSDKAIILSVILAAVLCVAVPFIFRVCRYRRRMKTLIVPDGPSGEVAVGTVPTPEAEYLARYICLLRLPFAGNKHVKIRPSYHGAYPRDHPCHRSWRRDDHGLRGQGSQGAPGR